MLLSDQEKQDLIDALQENVNHIQEGHDKLEDIKNKSKNILGN